MKQTLFNVQNLFNAQQEVVHSTLLQLSTQVQDLEIVAEDQQRKNPLNIIDSSLSYVDEMEIMLIFKALVAKGYLPNYQAPLDRLKVILEALKYQNLNIVKFGLVKDIKSSSNKYNIIIVLQDDRDIVFMNNQKTIEYILINSIVMGDKILRESEFNELEYPRICLFEYDNMTNTLTHINTRIEIEASSIVEKADLLTKKISIPIFDDNGNIEGEIIRSIPESDESDDDIVLEPFRTTPLSNTKDSQVYTYKKSMSESIKDRISVMFNQDNNNSHKK